MRNCNSLVTSFHSLSRKRYLSKTRMNQLRISYNDWEIPQLIHLISIALEKIKGWMSFRDDRFFGYMGKEEEAIRSKFSKKIKYVDSNRLFFLPIVPPLNQCHPERIHPSHLQIFEHVRWMSRGISKGSTKFPKNSIVRKDVM